MRWGIVEKIYVNVKLEVVSLSTEDVVRTSRDNYENMEQYPEEAPLGFVG